MAVTCGQCAIINVLSCCSCLLQERGVYKAKWQQLLSQHTSASSTVERLQRDLHQLQQSHANLLQVNHALESRLLGHSAATAANSPLLGNVASARSPSRQPCETGGNQSHDEAYYIPVGQRAAKHAFSPEHVPAGRGPSERKLSWSSTGNLDRALAEHKDRVAPTHQEALEHSAMTLTTEQGNKLAPPQHSSWLNSEGIMARLTRQSLEAATDTGATHLPPSCIHVARESQSVRCVCDQHTVSSSTALVC